MGGQLKNIQTSMERVEQSALFICHKTKGGAVWRPTELRVSPLKLAVIPPNYRRKRYKNAEPEKMSHEALMINVMRATMQMDKNADSAFLYH